MDKKEQINWLSILKIVGNIISWTLLTLLIIVAGFLLYYVISTQIYAVKGEKYAPKFSLYTIISPSMTPNINVYDIVIDERIDVDDELKVGDVITFISTSSISNGMTITHRIVDIIDSPEGPKYKTKGDANLTPDYALVTKDKIIGKVKFRIPQLGRIQFFLSSKGGWLFIILIPAIIIVIIDILKLLNVVKIKQKVHKVEEKTAEEELADKERLEVEHKKQEELKKRLQEKSNKNAETPTIINEDIVSEDSKEEVNDETFIAFLDELDNIEPEEIESKSSEPSLDEIKARLLALEEDEEEIDLPKKIEFREEEIPDDIDLPTLSNDNKQEVVEVESVDIEEEQ
ncbi:MAG: signal peptidase I [Bacilli bacterium]